MQRLTPLQACLDFLDGLGIRYRYASPASARETNTADEVEDDLFSHTIARTVVLKGSVGYLLVAIPDEHHLELDKLRSLLGCNSLRFASDAEIAAVFPHGDVAALPPLSTLVGAPVYLDYEISIQHCVAIHAGSLHDLIYLKTEDLRGLPRTGVGSFSEPDYQLQFRNRVLARAAGAS